MHSHCRERDCWAIWMVSFSSTSGNGLKLVIGARGCGCTVWTQSSEPHSPELARTSGLIPAMAFSHLSFPTCKLVKILHPEFLKAEMYTQQQRKVIKSMYTAQVCKHTAPGFSKSPSSHTDKNHPRHTKHIIVCSLSSPGILVLQRQPLFHHYIISISKWKESITL